MAAPNMEWTRAVVAIAAADALAKTDGLTLDEQFAACDIASDARLRMWAAAPPSLSDLAWKLEQAIIYEDLEHDPRHPLNMVLRDLRQMAAAN